MILGQIKSIVDWKEPKIYIREIRTSFWDNKHFNTKRSSKSACFLIAK